MGLGGGDPSWRNPWFSTQSFNALSSPAFRYSARALKSRDAHTVHSVVSCCSICSGHIGKSLDADDAPNASQAPSLVDPGGISEQPVRNQGNPSESAARWGSRVSSGSVRVLVTGGAGFIGSHIVDLLAGAGHDVVVLDVLDSSTHDGTPSYLHPEVEYVWGDVRDAEAWRTSLRGVQAVCHQAARVGLGKGVLDIVDYVKTNAEGTAVGLRAMHAAGFRGRLVLASSMVIYGDGIYECAKHGAVRPPARTREALNAGRFDPRCMLCDGPIRPVSISEDAAPDPRSVYAATKLHQEHLCFTVCRQLGVPVIALRYHNVYGSRMPRDTPYSGVAAMFRSAIAEGRSPRVFEDGGQMRDFVHVTDVARANVIALDSDESINGAFNVCSGEPRTILDVARALSRAANGREPIVTGEFRLGDVRHIIANPYRASSLLGFNAATRFSEGMTSFAQAGLRAAVGH
jgi:dTDP-L-rhamnose 4-epimerase